jgi:hypothetical protein
MKTKILSIRSTASVAKKRRKDATQRGFSASISLIAQKVRFGLFSAANRSLIMELQN